MKQKNHDLTTAPVFPCLLAFTFPILCSILLQITYGTVDLLIVSNFASTGDLSGVTIGDQVMKTLTNFSAGIAMGTTILLGRFIGEKKPEKATQVVGVSLAFFLCLALVMIAVIWLFVDQIATALNTPETAYEQMTNYLKITGSGAIFIVFYNLLGSVFRGLGDSKTPLYAVGIACVINIALDLLFVAVFSWGASGAAFATVTAQGCSVLISFAFLRKKELPFSLSPSDVKLEKKTAFSIVSLGFPVALQSVLVGISFLVITSIINVFGEASSAGGGVVEKITGLIMVVPIAFMQSLSAFTAQNLGANKMDRAKQALVYAIGISLVFGGVMAYIAGFHGTLLTQFFVKDQEEVTMAALEYLRSYAIDTVLVCFIFSFTGFFNGCGKTKFVMCQAVLGAVFIRIPLAYYFSSLENTNLFLIGLATPASTAVQIILFFFYYYWCFVRKPTQNKI
ncbi:MAG: MATE family efflux transporter [Eubacteriales bacterium]